MRKVPSEASVGRDRIKCLTPLALLADVIVLAELAAQVAPRKKDRARAAPPAQRVFFAQVRVIAGDDGPHANLRAVSAMASSAIEAIEKRSLARSWAWRPNRSHGVRVRHAEELLVRG